MATLYVENVPDDLYEALRKHAKQNHRSIAGEVLTLLERFYPTERELKRRRKAAAAIKRLRFTATRAEGAFPTSEEMIREDRER